VGVDELRPWHYGDPFFQRPPRASGPDLDADFKGKDPETLALIATDSIGLDARPILARSDNWPRPGKNQHAFCTWIEPDTSDIRVLNNLTESHHWTGVLLHELGHALAGEYADRSLPQRLIYAPNGIIAETESQTIDRMQNDPRWLRDAVGIEAARAERLAGEMRQKARLTQLIMIRWSLVQAHFERAIHRDPRQNLRQLWWEMVERFQLVKRPDGRDAPDWAAKSRPVPGRAAVPSRRQARLGGDGAARDRRTPDRGRLRARMAQRLADTGLASRTNCATIFSGVS
jgi:peptidyl-dipeptidase A